MKSITDLELYNFVDWRRLLTCYMVIFSYQFALPAKSELSPYFINNDCYCIREIQAAIRGHHWYADLVVIIKS